MSSTGGLLRSREVGHKRLLSQASRATLTHMPDRTRPTNHPTDARDEALSWLAGQFRWESLLADLHELAEREAAPVTTLDEHRQRDEDSHAA